MLGAQEFGFATAPLVTLGIGWALAKYVLKSGFGNSIAKGIMAAGIATFIGPMLAGFTGSLVGGGAGAGTGSLPTGA